MPQMRQRTPPQWTVAIVRLSHPRASALAAAVVVVVLFYIAAYGISI